MTKVEAAMKLIEAYMSPAEAAKQLGLGRSTAYRGGFELRLKAGSVRHPADMAATHVTLKLSSGSGGVWFELAQQLVRTAALQVLHSARHRQARRDRQQHVDMVAIDRPRAHRHLMRPRRLAQQFATANPNVAAKHRVTPHSPTRHA